MKALYAGRLGDYGIADRPVPCPGSGEVQIKVLRAGFCANDVRVRDGILTGAVSPVIPGHQYAGVVQECGRDVNHTRVGDRVAVHPYVLCGQCPSCRNGGTHDCERFRILGFTLDGGMAQYNVSPERCLFRLPDDISMDEGALLENLSNAVAAVRRVGLRVAERVLVIGATPIGMLAIQVARLSSPESIVMVGAGSSRLQMAIDLRVSAALEIRDPDISAKAAAALPGGADAVLICGYGARDFDLAINMVASGGRVLVEGHYDPLVQVEVTPRDLADKSVTLVPSRGWSTPDFQRSLDLASGGKVELNRLITHTHSLEDWESAYELFSDVDSGAVQVAIAPNGVGDT